jgi:hypothetical protein
MRYERSADSPPPQIWFYYRTIMGLTFTVKLMEGVKNVRKGRALVDRCHRYGDLKEENHERELIALMKTAEVRRVDCARTQ